MKLRNRILISLAVVSASALTISHTFSLVAKGVSELSFEIGAKYQTVKFYIGFEDSSWSTSFEVKVIEGSSVDSASIPTPTLSGYTFKGWTTSVPDSDHYVKEYTNTDIAILPVNEATTYYPIMESDSDYALIGETYYEANKDVNISSFEIANTVMGKRYLGIDGIPNVTASYNDTRGLFSASGVYQFRNDNGNAQIYRKVGFKPNTCWLTPWDEGTPTFGLYAWSGEYNYSVFLGYEADSDGSYYGYIPATFINFKFIRNSHLKTEFDFSGASQSSNLSFANDWWWNKQTDNKYTSSSIVLALNDVEYWENWGPDQAHWTEK